MKTRRQVRAENSAASEVNQGKKINSVETSPVATPGEDQTAKLLKEFESCTSNVQNDIETLLVMIADDQLRGLTYVLRGHFTELIDAGRALAGVKQGDAKSVEVQPGITADDLPYTPVWPSEEITYARQHIQGMYNQWFQKPRSEAVCVLMALGHCMEHHPKLATELEAIVALYEGDNNLSELEQGADEYDRPLTGSEIWLSRKLTPDLTLEASLRVIEEARGMLRDSPLSEPLVRSIDRMLWAKGVFDKLARHLNSM